MFENLQKKYTRHHLNERIIFAYFIVLIIFYICLRLFQFLSINFYVVSFFLLFCEFVRHINHSFRIDIRVSNNMNSRTRWHRIEKWIDETKKKILKCKFYRIWNQKISRKKRRWQFVFDQKKHCFWKIFKIIVAKISNWKKK